MIQLQPDAHQSSLTNLFRFDELQTKVASASDGKPDIAFENLDPTGLAAGEPYRRLIERSRTLAVP